MATPSSGAISLNDMHVEAGGSSGSECSINDADIRLIANKDSGATVSWNDYYNRAADWSMNMTLGDGTHSTTVDYTTTTKRFRGYHKTSPAGTDHSTNPNGIGSMTDYQDADYLGNYVIEFFSTIGTEGVANYSLRLVIESNGAITNNDTQFKSVVVSGINDTSTTFNRSDASFSQNPNADDKSSMWTWSVSGTVPTAANVAYPPFGYATQTNIITFRRSR